MLAIVQFDCAATPLVERLLAEGRLPALAALRERGQWLTLDTPAEVFPAGTYHTLYSGQPLEQQGQHYAFMWRPKEQRLDYRTTFPSPASVWELAAEKGKRSLVIDPYESHQPEHTLGTVLSGWQFENVIALERWSSPPAVRRSLERLFGKSPLLQEVFGRPSARYLLGIRRTLLGAPARVAAAAEHLIPRESPELVWLTLLSSHLAGHMFWDLSSLDEEFDADAREVLSRTLADVYEACDAAIGRIVRALPEGADIMLVSVMGMGLESSRVDVLPGMLGAVLSGEPAASGGGGLLWRIRSRVPVDARAVVARVTGRRWTQKVVNRLHTAGTDWSATRAFMLPSDHHGQIRLNVRGRERDGIVDPGDVDALIAEITEGLMSFVEPDGTRSIERVWRTTEVVPDGPARAMLPDLVVKFAESPMAVDGVSVSPRYGAVRRDGVGTGRTGGHTTDAWALVAPGAGTRVADVPEPAVADIPATAYSLLGLHAEGVTGRPLLERVPVAARTPA